MVFTTVPLYFNKEPQSPTAYTFASSILLAITELVKLKKFNVIIANMIHTTFAPFFILYKLFSHPFLNYIEKIFLLNYSIDFSIACIHLLYSGSFSTQVINVIVFSSVGSKLLQSVFWIISCFVTIYVFCIS